VPHLRAFNSSLQIDEVEFVRAVRGTFKLGIQFVDWGSLGSRYIHGFGTIGHDYRGLPFHQYWLKLQRGGKARDIGEYSLNTAAAPAGKFMSGAADVPRDSPLSQVAYAYHFDAGLYAQYLRRYAEARGVRRVEGEIVEVTLRSEDGFIESLTLKSGVKIAGELFIDCSGFRGLLIEQALETGYEDWTHWLPCDRAIAAPCSHGGRLDPFTRSTAHDSGWQWRIPLQHRMGNGHVYCSAFISDDDAEQVLRSNLEGELLAEPRRLSFTTGRRKLAWNRNVISLGLASGFVEPLESTSIHLIQAGIARLIALFPDKRFNPIERDEYNRRMQSLFEWVRDFIILHYKATARDDSEFWKRCAAMDIPDSLAERIAQFRNKARVFADAELFNTVSWVSVMLGQGITPDTYEPVVDGLDEGKVAQALEQMRLSIRETAERLPTHEEFVAQCCAATNPATQSAEIVL